MISPRIIRVYSNGKFGKRKYWMHIETPLFSFIPLSKQAFHLMRENLLRNGYKLYKQHDGNKIIELENWKENYNNNLNEQYELLKK